MSSLTFTSPASAPPLVRRRSDSSVSQDTLELTSPPPLPSSGRLITAKDHASIQITVADVDSNGVAIKGAAGTVIALVGQVRANAEADDSINRLATQAGRASRSTLSARSQLVNKQVADSAPSPLLPVLKNVWSYQK